MTRIKTVALVAGVVALLPPANLAARRADAPPAVSQFQTREEFRTRLSDRQVQQILTRVRSDADQLRPAGSVYRQSSETSLTYAIDDLQAAADHLSDHITRRVVSRVDVEDVLRRGSDIDEALRQQRTTPRSWTALQRDLNELAAAFNLSWDARNPQYDTAAPVAGIYRHLTGTYEIDRSRSDDPRRAADTTLRRLGASERARVLEQVEDRLAAPDAIAIDREDGRVSIASSRSPQITFDVDGRARSEPGVRGGTMTTRASMYGDRLEVRVTGSNGTDFSATLEPLENGDALSVTRRLFVDQLTQPIEVRSVYRRTSATPDWSVYDDSRRRSTSSTRYDAAVFVPDNIVLTAALNQPVDLTTARQNDRISLSVRNSPQFDLEGATIDGYIVTAPSRVSNRTQLLVDFDRIRLVDGRSSNFAGVVEAVRGPDGRDIPFNGETVATDNSKQKEQAIQRGAIGAAVGAVIGAIAGGAKGAAVGAVLGGGGAAATVLIDDASPRTLPVGTEFRIRTRVY